MTEIMQGHQNRPQHLLGHEHMSEVASTIPPGTTCTITTLNNRPRIVSKLSVSKPHLAIGGKGIGIAGVTGR